MQQVETGSRFWWRALDASSLEPNASVVASTRPAHWPFNAPNKSPSKRAAFALHVPRDERRRRARRRAQHAGKASVLFAFIGTVFLTAAAGVATSTASMSFDDVRQAANARLTTSLVALGFGLDRVSVIGHRFTNDRDVFDALDLANVATLWQLDMSAILKRIERISWVESAQISRVFPSGLDITIRERTAAAIWSRDGKAMLVDATGRVLGPADRQTVAENPKRLPVIAGEGATTDLALMLTALNRRPSLQTLVAKSERIAERRWRLVLNNGSTIELAAEREIEGIDAVTSDMTLTRALKGPPVIIDLRTPGRTTVRPRAAAAATATATAAANVVSR